jgi:hypothetical protein
VIVRHAYLESDSSSFKGLKVRCYGAVRQAIKTPVRAYWLELEKALFMAKTSLNSAHTGIGGEPS